MKERRATNRFHCPRAVIYQSEAASGVGLVKDLGLDGVRLSCQEPLKVGQTIRVSDLEGPQTRELSGFVQWSIGSQAGIQFNQPVERTLRGWVGGFLRQRDSLLQRRELVRAQTSIPVKVFEQGIEYRGKLIDLCQLGGLLRSDLLCPTGTNLTLEILENGRLLAAEVVSGRYSEDCWHYSLRFVGLKSDELDFLHQAVQSALNKAA